MSDLGTYGLHGLVGGGGFGGFTVVASDSYANSDTWTRPADATHVLVTALGGGGGCGSGDDNRTRVGGDGGDSGFGGVVAPGGLGGEYDDDGNRLQDGDGGQAPAVGGSILYSADGGNGKTHDGSDTIEVLDGATAGSPLGDGVANGPYFPDEETPGYGGGFGNLSRSWRLAAGGGAAFVVALIEADSLSNSEAVTVGAGGDGSTLQYCRHGTDGYVHVLSLKQE